MSKNPWICALCRSIVSTRLRTGRAQQVRHQLGRDRHARLVLAVLPGVAVVGHDRGDPRRRRPAERVDHHQQLHQVLVDRVRRRLHDEHVGAADVLVDLERHLAVGEPAQARLPERNAQDTRRSPVDSCGFALPEKTFRSPKPVATSPSPLRGRFITTSTAVSAPHQRQPPDTGWGGRIRTSEYGIQSPAPYRLATPHHSSRRTPRRDCCAVTRPAEAWHSPEPRGQASANPKCRWKHGQSARQESPGRASYRGRLPAAYVAAVERFGQQHPPPAPGQLGHRADGVLPLSETGRRRWSRCRSWPPPARRPAAAPRASGRSRGGAGRSAPPGR